MVSTRSFGFADGRFPRFSPLACDQGEAPSASVDWKEGEGHRRGGTNFVMTLMIIIIIITIILIIIIIIIIIIITR